MEDATNKRKQIKYSYCFDENGKLVHINSLSNETRHAKKLYCLQCGQEMVANLGKIRAKHFSHKIDCACDGESYLHKLAKFRIREKFMNEKSFPIIFNRDFPCENRGKCQYYRKWGCQEFHGTERHDLKYWEAKPLYDSCLEEVNYGEFRPDLLLKCSTNPDVPPIFVEIYKTHQSSEAKVNSEHKIIETKKIESEADIDDIIKRGFVEGENCMLWNFHPKRAIDKSKIRISVDRFILYNSGKAYVEALFCDKRNKRIRPKSVVELNVRKPELGSGEMDGHILDSYEKGLLYLKREGMPIRNCILCKNYVYNDYLSNFICKLYKKIGVEDPCPEQSLAGICEHYELSNKIKNYPLSKLEEDVSRVLT